MQNNRKSRLQRNTAGEKKLDYKAKYPVDCDPWDVPELGYQV